MTSPRDPFSLAEWRRQVAELYASVRQGGELLPEQSWQRFVATRNALFAEHAQTPLSKKQLATFEGLPYFAYDPAFRVMGEVEQVAERRTFGADGGKDGTLSFTRVGRVHFVLAAQPQSLDLYWIDGYGGGLFLPFRDGTNGRFTYGGGRYLYDGIKGADLGVGNETMLLDFNFAYNPSCAYNAQWVCPLAPPENRLAIAIEAGEQKFEALGEG